MRNSVLVAVVAALASAVLLAGCGKNDDKPVQRAQQGQPLRDLPGSGRLGRDHLRLLTAQDVAEVLGKEAELQCETERDENGMTATVHFRYSDSVFELATYEITRVKDIEADAKEERRKAEAAGFKTFDVAGLGDRAFCYENRSISGWPKHVFFWNEPQKLRIALTACEMPVQKAAELAGKIQQKLPRPAAQPTSAVPPPNANPPTRTPGAKR